MLARSKDLDDDIAVDILAEMHGLAGLKHMKSLESREIEEQLAEIHQRVRATLKYAAYLIETAIGMGRLNKCYARSLSYHFNIFKEVCRISFIRSFANAHKCSHFNFL